ncbi:MAG: hypothetical protein IT260_19505 [Saprospiraceae bacterium]|nr:hypothetical protein [Saprospiraceae bacterium]
MMKTQQIPKCLLTWVAILFSFSLAAQDAEPADSTGLPGDNFSLEGAIDLFKKAESPEDFEKLLNTESNGINNLDLNEDGEIDYIRVIDNMEGDAHALVLQVAVNEAESQDVAVIEIEKDGNESAMLQIVGDEDLYGEQVIAEPFVDEKSSNGRDKGPSMNLDTRRIIVNVWLWPSVRFMYRPAYVVWASPWRWRHYPGWWRPWRPHPFHVYHARVRPFHRHYHVVTTHRVVRAHGVYAPRRTHSKVVHTKTTTVVASRGKHGTTVGKKTTTTTTKQGRRGGTVTKKETKTQGVHKGRNGRVNGAERTTTKTTRKRGRN